MRHSWTDPARMAAGLGCLTDYGPIVAVLAQSHGSGVVVANHGFRYEALGALVVEDYSEDLNIALVVDSPGSRMSK